MARRAKATAKLLEQVNASAPARSKTSDGWIGDTAHQATKSDHNQNSAGVVQAQDITHDPRGGFDSYKFAELLRTKQDRRIKYCLVPGSRILTAQLECKPIETLSVGDQLIGFDEQGPWKPWHTRGIYKTKHANLAHMAGQRMRTAVVEAVETIQRPCFEIKTDRGTTVASADHQWLASLSVHGKYRSWIETWAIQPGVAIEFFAEPWVKEASFDAGWLAGLFDGEGLLEQAARRWLDSPVAQRSGHVLERAAFLADAFGIDFENYTNGPVQALTIRGGLPAVLSFLGRFPSIRLTEKAIEQRIWENRSLRGMPESAIVQDIKSIGEIDVIAMQTSTRTFIAEGMFSHNCISNRKIFAGNDGPSPWKWRGYAGANPHDQHVHVSVEDAASLYDDDTPWDIGIAVGIPDPGAPIKTLPLLKLGDKGFYVELLQTLLKKKGEEVDGIFGAVTRTSVIQFQRDHNLDDDGKVGDYTWRELLRPWAKEVKLITPDPYETLNKVAVVAKGLGAQGTVDEIAGLFAAVVKDILPPLQPVPPVPPEQPEPGEPEPPPTLPPETYGSLIGGFFSADPYDKKVPTSVRTNNPGALNTSAAVAKMPGYVGASETSPGNKTAIFYTPEQGSAAYWDLMRRYRAAGAKTVSQIINRYGGGQDYSAYLKFVVKTTGLPASYEIKIDGTDDSSLLKFAKAMFRYESGRETPLSDAQIAYGFRLGRGDTRMSPAS